MSDSQDRIHPATPYRQQEARRQGRFAKSRDLAAAVFLLAALAVVFLGDPHRTAAHGLRRFARACWSTPTTDLQTDSAAEQGKLVVVRILLIAAPLLGLLMLSAAAGHLLQTGWIFSPKKLFPETQRIHPSQSLRRMFSWESWVRSAFSVCKAGVVAVAAGAGLWSQRWLLLRMSDLPAESLPAAFLKIAMSICWPAAAALLVLGAADYAWERWRFQRSLQMTEQELREERRGRETDPQIRARRRQMARSE